MGAFSQEGYQMQMGMVNPYNIPFDPYMMGLPNMGMMGFPPQGFDPNLMNLNPNQMSNVMNLNPNYTLPYQGGNPNTNINPNTGSTNSGNNNL
jgi:hypothetical protein